MMIVRAFPYELRYCSLLGKKEAGTKPFSEIKPLKFYDDKISQALIIFILK